MGSQGYILIFVSLAPSFPHLFRPQLNNPLRKTGTTTDRYGFIAAMGFHASV